MIWYEIQNATWEKYVLKWIWEKYVLKMILDEKIYGKTLILWSKWSNHINPNRASIEITINISSLKWTLFIEAHVLSEVIFSVMLRCTSILNLYIVHQ